MLMLADVAGSLVGLTATHWLKETVLYGDLTLARHGDFPEVALSTPGHVRAGEPFVLDMLVRPKSSGRAKMELLRDGYPVSQEEMQLIAGDNHKTIPAVVGLDEKRSRVVYEVKTLSGADGTPSVPAAFAACPIYVDSPPRVLVVESQPVLAEPLKKALAKENVAVEVRPELPDPKATSGAAIGQYDLIILSNVPADAISKPQMAALQSYVRDGGGLIAVGGDHAFTVGGYRHTPLDEMLPVISESHTTKPKPALAMVLVLDISGSMNDPVSKGEGAEHRPGERGAPPRRSACWGRATRWACWSSRTKAAGFGRLLPSPTRRKSSPGSTPSRPRARRTCILRWKRPISPSVSRSPT